MMKIDIRRKYRAFIAGAICPMLAACGLVTPNLQEFYESPGVPKILVNHIVNEVKCELIEGMYSAVEYDKLQSQANGGRKLEWIEDWSAKVTLTLTVLEQSALGPGLSLNNPLPTAITTFADRTTVTTPQISNLGLGGQASSMATRIDKLDFFFAFRDFLPPNPRFNPTRAPCIHYSDILIESNLKLGEWIDTATFANYTASIKRPNGFKLPMSAISHQVQFVVLTSGSVTPSWKLVRVSANPSGSFFSTGRTRTSDVLVTLGPTADADAQKIAVGGKKKKSLLVAAAPSQSLVFSHLASEIGVSVANSVRGLQ